MSKSTKKRTNEHNTHEEREYIIHNSNTIKVFYWTYHKERRIKDLFERILTLIGRELINYLSRNLLIEDKKNNGKKKQIN